MAASDVWALPAIIPLCQSVSPRLLIFGEFTQSLQSLYGLTSNGKVLPLTIQRISYADRLFCVTLTTRSLQTACLSWGMFSVQLSFELGLFPPLPAYPISIFYLSAWALENRGNVLPSVTL